MVRSSDQWAQRGAKPEVVVDTPIDDRDPSITQLSDGDLLLTFMSYDKERQPDARGLHRALERWWSHVGRVAARRTAVESRAGASLSP
jgi:hypothetical protein